MNESQIHGVSVRGWVFVVSNVCFLFIMGCAVIMKIKIPSEVIALMSAYIGGINGFYYAQSKKEVQNGNGRTDGTS